MSSLIMTAAAPTFPPILLPSVNMFITLFGIFRCPNKRRFHRVRPISHVQRLIILDGVWCVCGWVCVFGVLGCVVCVCVRCVCGVCVYICVWCVCLCEFVVCVWVCVWCACVVCGMCLCVCMCVWCVCVCGGVCVFFLHSMPHYTVILHSLHNLRFN